MKRTPITRNERGYGAILAAVVLFLMCAVGIAILGSYALRNSQRRDNTGSINRDVYDAILGNAEQGTFGHLGDSGTYPSNLSELLLPGTNGPLVRDVPFDNNGVMLDGFLSPIEYWRSIGSGTVAPTTHGIAIISRGPDHVSSFGLSNNNPNNAALFAGVAPSASTYTSTSDNLDNMVAPNIFSGGAAINVGYTGTLTYNFTNRDTSSGTTIGMCPGVYTLEIFSETRGVTERLMAPVGPSTGPLELVQGTYVVRLLTNTAATINAINQVYFTDSVTVTAGATTTRTVNVNSVATATSPNYTLRVRNETGANLWIYRPRTASNLVSALATGGSALLSPNACERLQARTAAGSGGTLIEEFYMANGVTSKTFVLSTDTRNVSVTSTGTGVFGVVLSGNPGMVVGSVYKLRRQVFALPRLIRVQVITNNGTAPATKITASLTVNVDHTF